MLSALMDKVDSMQKWAMKQRDENFKKNQKEMLETKNTVTEMKDAFD